MKIFEKIRSAGDALVDVSKKLGKDVALPQRVTAAKLEVLALEQKLAKLERASDTYSAGPKTAVAPRELTELRRALTEKRTELGTLTNQLELRHKEVREAQQQVYRNIK